MKRTLILAFGILFSVTSKIEAKLTPEKIYEEANYVCGVTFVVEFEGMDASSRTSSQNQTWGGSCAAIEFDGQKIILTAAHIFDFDIAESLRGINGFRAMNGKTPWVRITTFTASTFVYFKNYPLLKIPAVVKEKDKDADLAIIEPINKTYYKYIKTARLGNEKEIKIGNKVMTIGNPNPLNFILIVGNIAQILDYPYPRYIFTSPMINPGNSGGPLLNERGECIGIAKGMYPDLELSYSIFVRIEDIKDFLKKYVKTP